MFLQQELDGRGSDLRRNITLQRLLQLYEPVLVTDRVDVNASDDAWIDLLRHGQRRFFALTTDDVLKALVPRDALIAALIARLATTGYARAGGQPVAHDPADGLDYRFHRGWAHPLQY